MKTKNVTSIFLTKLTMIYRIVLFLIILTMICLIIASACFLPILNGLRMDLKALHISDTLGRYIGSIFRGEDASGEYVAITNMIEQIGEMMTHWNTNIVVSVIILFVIIVLFAVLYYMGYYSISDITNTFMSSNGKFGFASNFIYNIKKSFIFALLYTPYALIMYVGGGALSICIGLLISEFSPMFGLFMTYLIMITILALRRALTAYWLPIMIVEGESAPKAFVKNFIELKSRFWNNLGEYFIMYMLGIMVLAVCTIATVGVALIFGFAILLFIMQIMDLVDYYQHKGYKYYVDDQTVVDPKKKYKDAVADEDSFKL